LVKLDSYYSPAISTLPFIHTILRSADEREDNSLDGGFYVYNLFELTRLYENWQRQLPNVKLYYAVKCNSDEQLLIHLAELGACFDCASPAEIDLVLKHTRVHPSKILYANPQKSHIDIRSAIERGVSQTTFDSVYELDKIASIIGDHPQQMKCLLRFYANDPTAQCPLSHKFGALPDEWPALLQRARELGLSVIGMSFHVGSGAKSPAAFQQAIQDAHKLYNLGLTFGYTLSILDIGGGFTQGTFDAFAETIRHTLQSSASFPFTLIAEPGRYFTETVATLMTKVSGRRDRGDERHYYITDSIYGSFNAMMYDHLVPRPIPYITAQKEFEQNHPSYSSTSSPPSSPELKFSSTLFGATCDGLDTIVSNVLLPELQVGDWIMWPNMGAYTIAGASLFNGFGFPFIPKFYM